MEKGHDVPGEHPGEMLHAAEDAPTIATDNHPEESGTDSASRPSVPLAERPRLEQAVDAFERAWRHGQPRITDFIPRVPETTSGSLDYAIAYELALIDLEYRLKRGQDARLEEYLSLLPACRDSRAFIREAVAVECALRCRRGDRASLSDYVARFPALATELPSLLAEILPKPAIHMNQNLDLARRYLEHGLLGRGGMGDVHHMSDAVLKRDVAMKSLRSDKCTPRSIQQFMAEACVSGQLDHPNIAPVYDLGVRPDGLPYFTMKLVAGETFTEQIRRAHAEGFHAESLDRLLRIFLKVCDGVHFAHSKGVVHRDLKPHNVMVGGHGEVYVMDWGLSLQEDTSTDCVASQQAEHTKPTDRAAQQARSLAGTLAYMAPEQTGMTGYGVGTHTDIFGLGAILYEILCGSPPYSSTTSLNDVARGRFTPMEQIAPHPVPPALCAIAARAMQTDPLARFESVGDVRAAVERFQRTGGWGATRLFVDGEAIVTEGDRADTAYLLVSGECTVEQCRNGVTTHVRTLRAGDVFGETAILTRRRRTATVRARGDVVATVITADALDRELERSELVHALVKQLVQRMLEKET